MKTVTVCQYCGSVKPEEADYLRAKVAELEAAHKVNVLALESAWGERDRYRTALEKITHDTIGYAYLSIARDALAGKTA